MNHYICNTYNKSTSSIHAEHDAINRLPTRTSKKKMKVHIIIIRIKKNNKTGMSKPCKGCIEKMSRLLLIKGYRMVNVQYSNDHGSLDKIKFNKLKNEKNPHVSRGAVPPQGASS